jgi:hypothetical protein
MGIDDLVALLEIADVRLFLEQILETGFRRFFN